MNGNMEVDVQIRDSYPVSGQCGLFAVTEIKEFTQNFHDAMCLPQSLTVYI